jgi:membrane associated rhomboid family serine protease
MIEDRYYMRAASFQPRRSATLYLVIINAAIFLIQSALAQFAPSLARTYLEYFPLSLGGLEHGYVWQLLSYQFMHAGIFHVLFNCWAIYVFGMDVEHALGRRNFLTLYFLSGIVGGLVQILAGLLSHRFAGPVVGASAAAFGLAAAFSVLFPDRVLLLFMVIPVRAKYLLIICAVLALIGIAGPQTGIADAAHLGGMLTGFVLVRYAINWNWHWPQFRRRPSSRTVRVGSRSSDFWGRARHTESEEVPPEDFLSKEVDPILDKISAHGIQSLTQRERRILEAAREKMVKR